MHLNRRLIIVLVVFCGFFLPSLREAQAISIGLGDFSGAETVVDLSNLPGPEEMVVVVGDLTFTSTANFLKQSGLSETSTTGSFTLDLASPQSRVGLELKAFEGAIGIPVTWSVQAFATGLAPLETAQFSQTAAGDSVFAGIERSEGIARLVVSEVTPHPTGGNYFTFINEARFEQIPEPATFATLLLALISGPIFTRSRGLRHRA